MLKLTVEKNAGGEKLFSLLFALHCYFIKSFFSTDISSVFPHFLTVTK